MTREEAKRRILERACRTFCYEGDQGEGCGCDSLNRCYDWSTYLDSMSATMDIVGHMMAGKLGRALAGDGEVREQLRGPRRRVLDL